jgi:hypothetical protein
MSPHTRFFTLEVFFMARFGIVGDIHGSVGYMESLSEKAREDGLQFLIQVGDFGIYPFILPTLYQREFQVPIYFIDGNHENFTLLNGIAEPVDGDIVPIMENLNYVKRGSVLEICGSKFAFLGGAASVDKAWRTPGVDWFEEEIPTDEEMNRLRGVTDVDYFITHTPPTSVIERNFDPKTLLYFNLPMNWKDSTAVRLDDLWDSMNFPKLYCGHMHRHVVDGRCTILDIDEQITII